MIEVHNPQLSPSLVGHLDIPLTMAFECDALIFPVRRYFTENLERVQKIELLRLETRSIEDDDLKTGEVYRTNVVIVHEPGDLEALQLSGLYRARSDTP